MAPAGGFALTDTLRPAFTPLMAFDTYREYLLYLIEVRKDVKGIRTRLAEAASCQPSYLTQVLSGTASLSMDQLRGIARYLELSDAEWDYLRELGILDRAASAELRADCLRRLQRLREMEKRDGEPVEPLSPAVRPTTEDIHWYVSHWAATAICAAVHSRVLRTPEAIAKKLGLPTTQALELMKELETRGFLARGLKGEWRASLSKSLFLGRERYVPAFRGDWFSRGQRLVSLGYKGGCQLGGVICLPREEYDALRAHLTAEFRKFFAKLPEETDGDVVAYYSIDLFEA